MGNYSLPVRAKRWAKFLVNYASEKVRGLDFSMVYVGDIQRNVEDFHGYSTTDAGDMRRMLKAVPVDPGKSAFIDVGCGKGMCMKCAVESGYKKVAGLDLDGHLLDIARRNMKKLGMDVECMLANAVEFDRYSEFDVFYFYNPFGRGIFEQVLEKIKTSQEQRNRDIWAAYYHPVFADVFEKAGFILKDELRDKTRDTTTRFYCYPKR
jgi:ribosomal protein L11 methylase PrmA